MLLLFLPVGAGCSLDETPLPGTVASGDAGGDGDADADADGDADGDADCPLIFEDCPEEMPNSGASCLQIGACTYCGMTYRCEAGEWQAPSVGGECCDGNCGTPPPSDPPRAETCEGLFQGELAGATLEVGPSSRDDAFRPFDDGEDVQLHVRTGSEQDPTTLALRFRVRVVHDHAPRCVAMTASLSGDGWQSDSESLPLRLRCGESLEVAALVAREDYCAGASPELTLTVSLDGIGEVSVALVSDASCD